MSPGRRVPRMARSSEHDDLLDRARRHDRRRWHESTTSPARTTGRTHRSVAPSTRPTTGSGTYVRRCPPVPSLSSSRSRCRPAAPPSTTAGRSTAVRPTNGRTRIAARSSATRSRPPRGGTRRPCIRSTHGTAGPVSASSTRRSFRSCGATATARHGSTLTSPVSADDDIAVVIASQMPNGHHGSLVALSRPTPSSGSSETARRSAWSKPIGSMPNNAIPVGSVTTVGSDSPSIRGLATPASTGVTSPIQSDDSHGVISGTGTRGRGRRPRTMAIRSSIAP